MENQQIEALLKDSLGLNEVHVTGDGSHFQIIAISDQFAEMSRVKTTCKCHCRGKYARRLDKNVHSVTMET